MSSVKETKELAIGVIALGFHVAKAAKDGLQFSDVSDLLKRLNEDAEFKAKLEAAYKGIDQVGTEVKAIDMAGGLELAMAIVPVVIKELGELK